MATVRAKFFVTKVDEEPWNDGYRIEMQPVVDGSEENKEFFKFTPAGTVILSTINREAAKAFGAGGEFYGKEFYVEFTPAG